MPLALVVLVLLVKDTQVGMELVLQHTPVVAVGALVVLGLMLLPLEVEMVGLVRLI